MNTFYIFVATMCFPVHGGLECVPAVVRTSSSPVIMNEGETAYYGMRPEDWKPLAREMDRILGGTPYDVLAMQYKSGTVIWKRYKKGDSHK